MASCPGSSFIFLSVRRATPPPSPLRKGTRYLAEAHRGRPSGPLAAFGHIVLVAFLPGDGLDVSDSAPLRSALFPLLSMLLHSHQVFLRPVCLDCPFPHTPRHSLMLGVEAVASLVGAAELLRAASCSTTLSSVASRPPLSQGHVVLSLMELPWLNLT